jgi:hypothetical protein
MDATGFSKTQVLLYSTRRHSVISQKTTVVVFCVGMMSEICDRKYGPYLAIIIYYLWHYTFTFHSNVAKRWLSLPLN